MSHAGTTGLPYTATLVADHHESNVEMCTRAAIPCSQSTTVEMVREMGMGCNLFGAPTGPGTRVAKGEHGSPFLSWRA